MRKRDLALTLPPIAARKLGRLSYQPGIADLRDIANTNQSGRVDWVDAGKGFCIIMVVMIHSTLGIELAAGQDGWMHYVVAFARPFRMPDFFLISGLFLALVIDRPWRRYIDRKVVHFAYFYLLWLTIQFAFKAPGITMEQGWQAPLNDYLTAFVQPFGTLWFIYLLPIFFVFTRVTKTLPVWFVFVWAALMEALPIVTGSVIFDEFCQRFVYLFAGYAFATLIFAYARWVRAHPAGFLAICLVWAPLHTLLVFTPAPASLAPFLQPDLGYTGATGGFSELPIISLGLGLIGCCFVVGVAALISLMKPMRWIVWLGEHSIVVYLAFFLPMATARVFLLKTGIISDVGTMSLLVTASGVAGAVVIYGLVQWTGYCKFLFDRPEWARIDPPREAVRQAQVAAE